MSLFSLLISDPPSLLFVTGFFARHSSELPIGMSMPAATIFDSSASTPENSALIGAGGM